jgi:serine/threonine protein kinase
MGEVYRAKDHRLNRQARSCPAGKSRLSAGRDRLGAYEVRSALGAGGMGIVYRAHGAKLNRDVALKVLLPEVAQNRPRSQTSRSRLPRTGTQTMTALRKSPMNRFISLTRGRSQRLIAP